MILNKLDKIFLTGLFGIGSISGFSIISQKYYTYQIHKEISKILDDSINCEKIKIHEIPSSNNNIIKMRGWTLDKNNKHLLNSKINLYYYYDEVDIKDNKNPFNNKIKIKPSSNKNNIEVEFYQD